VAKRFPDVWATGSRSTSVHKELVQRDFIMKKTLLLMVALLSLALAGGCARGGNGIVPIITVNAPSGINPNALYPTEPNLKFTAAVSGTTNTTVTWSLIGTAGTACTGTPNPCGTIDPTTGVYQAPAAPVSATVKATLTSDSTIKGGLGITVVDVTTDVAPAPVAPATLSIGQGLTQTFTAVAVPDDAATQHFTWTCTVAGGGNCANFVQDPKVSGLARYTAQDTCSTSGCVQISAITPLDANGCSNSKNCTVATASLVSSRVNGTYAFRFSGYDASNHATAVVGTFTALNGTITSGTEDELTSFGPASHSITGGTYTPISSSDPNSNNAGTLTLTLPSGVHPNQYRVVLDGAGDIEMIESDGQGTGSGIARISSNTPTQIFKGNQTFAFGFTGVDSGGSRVGYAGLLPMNSTVTPGQVAGGLMDVNDNGNSINSICGAPPCTVTGKYSQNGNGSWHLALTSPVNMGFDFFIASVTTSKTNPLTFYAISTDLGLPAVSGTMVLQDSTQTYNNAAFNGTSVTALTGTALTATATCAAPPCANVSLTLGTTDGNGNFSGLFDQNNAGAILSIQFPPSSGTNNYTYAASSSSNGRYTFNLLGDPTAKTVVAPLPFVLYASGANRGFLLEQGGSSPPDTSVMTGTMNPQGKVAFGFPGSALPGTFAAATAGSGSSAVDAIAASLLLTWVNTGACTSECVSGTQYDANNTGGVPLAGTYSIQSTGNGTITLGTAPSTQNFVIYALDTSGCTQKSPVCAVQNFLMMDVDQANPNASIIFAQQ
jgi:hypothetical protein